MAFRPRKQGRSPTDSVDIQVQQPPGDDDGPVEILIEPDATQVGDSMITETADGGVVVDLAPQIMIRGEQIGHEGNLAERMAESDMDALAADLIESVDADRDSRKEYERAYTYGMKLLGLTIEERTKPFKGAAGVFDPLLAEAVIRFHATAMSELMPAAGPVKTDIIGLETEETLDQADRVREWMNYYFLEIAQEFYPDFDQMLFWLAITGSTFRKVYLDPTLARPASFFITPDHFLVNYHTRSLFDCQRATHIIPTTRRDMIWKQINGFYRNVPLDEPDEKAADEGVTQAAVDRQEGRARILAQSGDDRHQVMEIHCDRDLKGFEHQGPDAEMSGLPLPYIVSIEERSRKVLSVRRNWKEGDELYRRRRYFVQYKFLPGLGFYGIGLAQLLGGYAKGATSILRQLLDSGTLANFPGGFRVRGMRIKDNNIRIGPNEFPEIDTGGGRISDAVMPLPYKEPSVVLKELRSEMVESARRLGATTDIAVGDGRQDAPVGTTVALLEAATKVEIGVIKRLYRSQRDELRMFAELFGQYLPESGYPFPVKGGVKAIMRRDFDSRVDVVPVGDPNIASSSQRMIRAEAQLRTALTNPQLHDLRVAYKRVYAAMGVENIDALLPPPAKVKPADPLTENQRALTGQPVAVGPWQDDEAHVQAHMPFAAAPGMQAHIAEHLASRYRKEIEKAIGRPLPQLGEGIPPEIENEIARLTAMATDAVKEKLGLGGGSGDALVEIARQEVQVKAAEVERKAAEGQAKIAQKAQEAEMDFRKAMADNATKLKTAKIKAYTDLADNRNQSPPDVPAAITPEQ